MGSVGAAYTDGMSRAVRVLAPLAACICCLAAASEAQSRRTSRRATPATPPTVAPADVSCPNVLGRGVRTRVIYCDVMTERDPAKGIRIKIPSHTGPARVTFHLHNRHLYSDEQIRAGQAFRRYTATIGALAADGALIQRAVVQSEFRTEKDLLDRIEGGTGAPVKAVAPLGSEFIIVEVPAALEEISLLGEKLEAVSLDGRELYGSPGRLIAAVSDIKVEYRARPAPKPPAKKR
jgi:hypothetical protein